MYQVSGSNAGRSLPDWFSRARKIASEEEDSMGLALIQDFSFDEASLRIKVTRDGQYAMATGVYKPQIHVYDFEQLSLKFERHTDAENVDFVLINDDWTKSVHLQNDRTIEFHAQGGIHTRSRIPKFGRCIAYSRSDCNIIVGAAGNEVYRLNIDQGRFLAPLESENAGVNVVDVNPAHGLIVSGDETGTAEFWDPRTRRRVASLQISETPLTAVTQHTNGLNFACGSEDGIVKLYDLRSPEPLLVKDQGYGFPIKRIGYLSTTNVEQQIYSADKRIVKIWDAKTGAPFTSIEPRVDINDVEHLPGSGMFFLANEGPFMNTYYVPAIGTAPKWCAFLDSITEELEEQPTLSVYENYKFITRPELKALNLSHLLGSNLLKAYMHGYFIHMRLYEQAKLISDPRAQKDSRKYEIKKKIAKERESRIRTVGSSKKTVNDELRQTQSVDERFKALFENPDFEIDKTSHEYKLIHGNQERIKRAEREALRPMTAADEEELEMRAAGRHSSSSDESQSDGDDAREERRLRKAAAKERRARRRREEEQQPALTSVEFESKLDLPFMDRVSQPKDAAEARPGSGDGSAMAGYKNIVFTPRDEKMGAIAKQKSLADARRKHQFNQSRRLASNNALLHRKRKLK